MKIIKKKTSELNAGDILIVDWKEIQFLNLPICMTGDQEDIESLKNRFEGETQIFLFEIDDIDIEYLDFPNEGKLRYTFFHIDSLLENIANIEVKEPINFTWDVIENPHTPEYYKQK